jgi:hypothetical protein
MERFERGEFLEKERIESEWIGERVDVEKGIGEGKCVRGR